MPNARELRRDRYRDWLAAQGLRFGFAGEIASLADRTRDGVQNDTPPVAAWHEIVPTVRVVEKLREKFGATEIRSAYRSPEYNRAVKGEADSFHMRNKALDVSCATGTPEQWAAELRALRSAGVFSGGIGTYATFVHVDTRGYQADWRG
jgi:uncharacterized protein YcbK (DUF882 family)